MNLCDGLQTSFGRCGTVGCKCTSVSNFMSQYFFFHTTGVTGGVDINFDLSLLYLLLYKFLF